jgi:hypothetical protein
MIVTPRAHRIILVVEPWFVQAMCVNMLNDMVLY